MHWYCGWLLQLPPPSTSGTVTSSSCWMKLRAASARLLSPVTVCMIAKLLMVMLGVGNAAYAYRNYFIFQINNVLYLLAESFLGILSYIVVDPIKCVLNKLRVVKQRTEDKS